MTLKVNRENPQDGSDTNSEERYNARHDAIQQYVAAGITETPDYTVYLVPCSRPSHPDCIAVCLQSADLVPDTLDPEHKLRLGFGFHFQDPGDNREMALAIAAVHAFAATHEALEFITVGGARGTDPHAGLNALGSWVKDQRCHEIMLEGIIKNLEHYHMMWGSLSEEGSEKTAQEGLQQKGNQTTAQISS